MPILIALVVVVVAFAVLNYAILPVVNALTKTSGVVRLISYLLVGLAVAFVLDRIAPVSTVTVALLAVVIWISSASSERLMDTADFRQRTGATIGRREMLASRAALVAVLVAGHLILSMEICSLPADCRPLLF